MSRTRDIMSQSKIMPKHIMSPTFKMCPGFLEEKKGQPKLRIVYEPIAY